jgi:ABC-2 type transport system ATP-binding protein
MRSVIKVSGLVKRFENVQALNGVSFEVGEGEMFGMAGPDGAGKTTTIRILCGLIQADDGTAEVLEYEVRHKFRKITKHIGYLSQQFSLYGDLSIDENIEFFAEIHGVKNYSDGREKLLDFTRLKPFRERLAGQLSGGMKQKLALACTLIHTPKIIFLDEPTTGVDPISRRDFWKILYDLKKDGVTIVMSTPYLDEAERFDRIALLNNGVVMKCGTPEQLKSEFREQIIEIECGDVRKAYHLLKPHFEVQMFGDRLDIAVSDSGTAADMIRDKLERNGITIMEQRRKAARLENVFVELMENQPQRKREGEKKTGFPPWTSDE